MSRFTPLAAFRCMRATAIVLRAGLRYPAYAPLPVWFGPTPGPAGTLGRMRADPVQTEPVRVEPMTAEHASQVLAIYQAGIDEGDATFELAAPGWEEFDGSRLPDHRFVALDPASGAVLGWVAASPVSGRAVYAGVVEHSVYVHQAARGRGLGALLLSALISSTEQAGIWTIQSGIFPENTASVALHEACGFRLVGRRERLGRQHGRWRDVLLLERRSGVI